MTWNPSIQCSVCGQWKRLNGKDDEGQAIQRFYPCCGENGQYEHLKPICDDCCKGKCPYRYKDTVIIYYIWWAMEKQDRWMWCAELNGEVIDYHKKEVLKKNAEEKGLPWIVLRHHKKGGKITVMESSTDNKTI